MPYDPDVTAELVESIHQPWRATVGECVSRWTAFDARKRSASFLVVHGEGGGRHTLNAKGIAVLAGRLG